jgi:predicted DNA-binding transcriptional regulator YafY
MAQVSYSKYFNEKAFTRLMLLIMTILRYPGVGHLERSSSKKQHHNATEEVQQYLLSVADEAGIALKCSKHTVHKDLAFLRSIGILEDRMYRWGYYLGSGVMSQQELTTAINALHSQAAYQRDMNVQELYNQLVKRLKGTEAKDQLFYPVRAHLNRSIVETDPVKITNSIRNRNLFDCLEEVEDAIVNGQKLQLRRKPTPWSDQPSQTLEVWPLQLLYYDIAWYLIHQDCHNNHLAISRLDRLEDSCTLLEAKGRSLAEQRRNLTFAHELLEQGWGLLLGNPEEQRQELMGQLELVEVRVRFFPKVMKFIAESPLRHPNQRIEIFPLGKLTPQTQHVDYVVQLPPRSLNEFSFWVYRFMGNAQVIAPESLVEQHREAAEQQAARYQIKSR